MNWFTFAFVAYLVIGVQLGLGGVLGAGAWMPSMPLVLVLFMSLHAPQRYALLTALLVGLGHDLISAQGLGTYVFIYGVIAIIVLQLRLLLYRQHPLTHVMLGLTMGLLVGLMLGVRNTLRGWLGQDVPTTGIGDSIRTMLSTTVLAPAMIYLLRKMRRRFAFRASEVEM
jgi:rod shape-determining protein MreD